MASSLQLLPDEIVQQIILYLPFVAVIQLEQTCQKARRLTGPLVWRNLCKTHFRYWSPSRNFARKLSLPPAEIDWRSLFIDRYQIDRAVDHGLDDILANQRNRTPKVERIVGFGWDCKDTLLRHAHSDNAEDILARRWHAGNVLGSLHRSIAIGKWATLADDGVLDESLETALAAFDLFISRDAGQADQEISLILDRMKCDFLACNEDFATLGLIQKATAIASYVRQRGLVGIDGDLHARYHDIGNNFIRHALSQPPHSSLPLISVAVYCSLAQRLNVDARPCGFPFHVLAVVQCEEHASIFMDPFRSDQQLLESDLRSQLVSMGIPYGDHQKLLGAASTREVVARCARNITNAVGRTQAEEVSSTEFLQQDLAFYAAVWALLITESNQGDWSPRQTPYLEKVLENVQAQFMIDTWLVQKHPMAFFDTAEPGFGQQMAQFCASVDSVGPQKPRKTGSTESVRHKVGQVFHHRRYQYTAIIIGWDVECAATEQWIHQMGVDVLPRGRFQSFYRVLVEDKSIRYVAEDNVEITIERPASHLLNIAGQYFKRWDESSRTFISNIRDEYPDD